MAAVKGFRMIRQGVYEPEGFQPPSRKVDRDRLKEIVERILSTNSVGLPDDDRPRSQQPGTAPGR